MPSLGDDHLIDHSPSLVVEHESGRFVHDYPPSFAVLLLARSMFMRLVFASGLSPMACQNTP
jgi:hypothetical protein